MCHSQLRAWSVGQKVRARVEVWNSWGGEAEALLGLGPTGLLTPVWAVADDRNRVSQVRGRLQRSYTTVGWRLTLRAMM